MIAATARRSNDLTLAGRAADPPKCPRKRVCRGETLHGVGDPFHALYVVRLGFLKSLILSDGGLIQVTGFQMEGDVIGLDGIAVGYHQSQVVASKIPNSSNCHLLSANSGRRSRRTVSG